MNYKILITTSGIGSRLGELTDFTNKSLIRVGDKPALSHIIENYPENSTFVITLGHYGDQVKEFLEMSYPSYDFEFVKVDKYAGTGTSLAYSILQAKDRLQCPFVFNACDAILHDNCLPPEDLQHNFCVGSKVDDSSQYTTLLVNNDQVVEIKDKGEINYDAAYAGICGIKDYESFWGCLEEAYSSDKNNTCLFEGTVINRMLPTHKFIYVNTDQWFDMGNTGELEKTRKFFASSVDVLEKKEESIYFFKDSVVKFFFDKKIVKNRVQRAKRLKHLVPEIEYSGQNFYKYKKMDGILFSKSVNQKSFLKLLHWSKRNLWILKQVDNFAPLCRKFYIDKTNDRIEQYTKNYEDSTQVWNGYVVPTAKELLAAVDIEWLCAGRPAQFHGDFILDNILETEEGFCLLDWRQDFGGNLEVGDIYYDLAKLNHNLIVNHEIANKGLFVCGDNDCYILCNSKLIGCKSILKDFVEDMGLDFKKVETLTSLIWINMAPLHEYPFSKFLFNFGKYNLTRCIYG